MSQTAFQRAMQEISARRVRAQNEQEARCREIEKKIPKFAEINRQIVQSLLQLMWGEQFDTVRKRNLEAQHLCKTTLKEHGYPEDYLDLHYTCSDCEDTGYADNGGYCHCLKDLASQYAVEDMNRTTQLRLCRFENFSLEYYQNPETSRYYTYIREVLEICENYARDFHPDTSPSMLFWGKAGTGKTHLSLSIVSEVLRKGYHVIYDSIGNLLAKVEEEHFQNHSKPEISTMQLLLDTDLLIMDDLGTEFRSAFTVSAIYTIINTRINKNLPTIISTNLDLNHDEITEAYTARLTSRMLTTYRTIQFTGVDVRKKRSEEGNFSKSFEEY